jgi:phage baseplate assembly protein W
MPWTPSDKDGLFKMNYTRVEADRDNLIFWAHTNKGERVMDANFGLDARRYLFEPMHVVEDVLTENARSQISKYFHHLVIEELSVTTQQQDSSMDGNAIRFFMKLRNKNNDDEIVIQEDIS